MVYELNKIKMNIFEKKLLPKLGLEGPDKRRNWIQKQLTNLPAGLTILDIGAGELEYKQYCKHLNYISLDFGKYDGMGNKEGLQTKNWNYGKLDIIGDAGFLGFQNNSIDVVLLTEVLEHVPEPIKVLREVQRVLRKNGKLILTAPFASLTHFSPYHFVTGFNQYFYHFHLPKLGFEIIEIKKNGTFFSCLSTELMRTKLISEQYTGKSLNFFQQFLILLNLYVLNNFAKHDKNSGELWCYGYHVLAKKIR